MIWLQMYENINDGNMKKSPEYPEDFKNKLNNAN